MPNIHMSLTAKKNRMKKFVRKSSSQDGKCDKNVKYLKKEGERRQGDEARLS